MGTIASQITSLTSVYSTVYSGADQSKHQSSASLAFVWGIHREPMFSKPKEISITWWRYHCRCHPRTTTLKFYMKLSSDMITCASMYGSKSIVKNVTFGQRRKVTTVSLFPSIASGELSRRDKDQISHIITEEIVWFLAYRMAMTRSGL